MKLHHRDLNTPITSSWVSANAGSGKTFNLINRVVRLLISGVAPSKILCITFTNSAAEEMKVRLLDRLAEWVTMESNELLFHIESLLETKFTDGESRKLILLKARQLFAEVLEEQSSLRISTIHSLCETILRHFSVETGIPFDFKIINEIEQRALIEELLQEFAVESNQAFININKIIKPSSEAALTDFTLEIISDQERLIKEDFFEYFPEFTEAVSEGEINNSNSQKLRSKISSKVLKTLIEAFSTGGNESQIHGKMIEDSYSSEQENFFEVMEKVFLTLEKKPRDHKRFPDKKVLEKYPQIISTIKKITDLILDIRRDCQTKDLYLKTKKVKDFGKEVVSKYEKKKLEKNSLDFYDLLKKVKDLLCKDGMMSWVNFKIDATLNHLLVDECQDVSPIQWEIINRIAGEFFDNWAAVQESKSIFIVGDEKQTIYSFQGADPLTFTKVKSFYSKKLKSVGSNLIDLDLNKSYRSSPLILNYINKVFSDPNSLGVKVVKPHQGTKSLPGRVEIWPIDQKQKTIISPKVWWESVSETNSSDSKEIFAERLAKEIRVILAEKFIPDENSDCIKFRKVMPNDIMILFRSRSPLYYEIIEQLNRQHLPTQGADRIILNNDISIKDIISLLKFLDNPLDDLSLAEALKSPFFNISEAKLFEFAYNREESLWLSFLNNSSESDIITEISNLLSQVDTLTTYELLEMILVENSGMEKLINRLGSEVYETVEAFLGYVSEFEDNNISSLASFLNWFSKNKLEIKRPPNKEGRQIKVMTIHASKGQESPIVILPDTLNHSIKMTQSKLVKSKNSIFFKQEKLERCQKISEIERANLVENEFEENRLLYVALSRTKYWLIISANGKTLEESWYQKCLLAYEQMSSEEFTVSNEVSGQKMVLEYNWHRESNKANHTIDPVIENINMGVKLKEIDVNKVEKEKLSPTSLKKIYPKPYSRTERINESLDKNMSLIRGNLIHSLFEKLSKVENSKRQIVAKNIAKIHFPELKENYVESAIAETLSVMRAKENKRFFSREARFEITIMGALEGIGKINGKIDCLLINDKEIEIVDFKTDRNPPKSVSEVSAAYIMQLGIYSSLIQRSFPDLPIFSYILWTKSNSIMPISRSTQKKYLAIYRHDQIINSLEVS